MSNSKIEISLAEQQLNLLVNGQVVRNYVVSTAKNGPGERLHSGCTPRGEHVVRLKIGANCPPNSVFVGRRPTGEIYTAELAARYPKRDWILSRILWLSGRQSGYNRGADCDTLRRFIYIHGTPDTEPMGTPVSHGCIRMRNSDIVELFDWVENNMPVIIN